MKQQPFSAVGQRFKDCLVTKHLELLELQSFLTELIHQPSGARILHISNSDPENLFCLGFQTLPDSSNGVAHILEHTVLCGSKKYPVKDPFFAMTRRSLNTYMNALTGQDFTCYPASSQVPKDFYNLLDVYLDAVFKPELKHLSFLQEGRRLQFTVPTDPSTPLQFQGVVYNEMKGAMSSIESRLWEALAKELTPDLTYAHNSGGNPKDIPSLSYEELIAFHREFYHPSRCLFFFYGHLPLQEHIDKILPYLHVPKAPLLPPLPRQKRYTEPHFVTSRFPIAEGESTEKKTQIVFSWLTAPISDQRTVLALCLLESILTDTDASPLTKAVLKSNLCTQVDSFLDIEMSEIPWGIVCKGCSEKQADRLQKVIFDTLAHVKISPEEVEAALHQLEFQRTEIGSDGAPFGLTLFMRAALPKQHGCEPEDSLLIHTLFAELKEALKDPQYLPGLLRKYCLDNLHFVRLILKPDPNLEKEEKEDEEKRLKAIQEALSAEEKAALVEQSKQLTAYQEAVEHQSLDCLPKVTLHDVAKHPQEIPLSEKGHVLHHNCFTNGILYADLVFELPDLTAEELPLLSLLSRLIGEVGAAGKSYEDMLHFQQAYIGGLNASLSIHILHNDPNQCRPTLSLRGRALYRNSHHLFQLMEDYSRKIDLTDKERIQEYLSQEATHLQSKLTRSAMSYAVQTSLSSLTPSSFIYNQWHGLPYYRAVMHWNAHCDDNLLHALQKLADKVLGLKNGRLLLACDEKHFASLHHLPHFDKPYTPWKGHFSLPKPQSEAYIIAAPVAFTALGSRTISSKDPQAPFLLIAAELMKNLVLHKEIREKGGAYGSGASYTPASGNFYFSAYRDPNLSSTLAAFKMAVEKIGAGDFNARELEEAKLGILQTLDSPIAPSNKASVAYAWQLCGRTYKLREQFRKALLEATIEDVAKAAHLLRHQKETLVSFLGQNVLDKEQPKLDKPLPVIAISN